MSFVQRYYDRLSLYNRLSTSEKKRTTRNLLHKLSHFEISRVACYLDHNDVMNFRRLSRSANVAACYGIIENIREFKKVEGGY